VVYIKLDLKHPSAFLHGRSITLALALQMRNVSVALFESLGWKLMPNVHRSITLALALQMRNVSVALFESLGWKLMPNVHEGPMQMSRLTRGGGACSCTAGIPLVALAYVQ